MTLSSLQSSRDAQSKIGDRRKSRTSPKIGTGERSIGALKTREQLNRLRFAGQPSYTDGSTRRPLPPSTGQLAGSSESQSLTCETMPRNRIANDDSPRMERLAIKR